MTTQTALPAQPLSVLICALGGEGGGVLTEWLVDAARRAGYAAQSTSIPGVAQRTGATTYYLEVYPVPLADLGRRRPVFSLNPLPGRLDALLGSELLESARQVANGMTHAQRTVVIASSARTLTTAERMVPGDGRRDAAELIELLRRHSRAHHVLDMAALARECGTVVSAVMAGALAASGVLPFGRAAVEEAIRAAGGGGAEASLRGFARAFEAVESQRAQARFVEALLARSRLPAASQREQALAMLPAELRDGLPAALHELAALGHARVVDYQDAAYGRLYAERLLRVAAAERAATQGTPEAHTLPATHEMARWLALWMAFDDIVRVAELKARASRALRVAAEVRAQPGELLRVYDHFKPGAPEFAALLPETLAQRVLAWDRRRQAAGREPFALPIRLASHSVTGLVALRLLAGLRGLRRRGSRFALEQALLQRWLDAVVQALGRDAASGLELARCGRLIKGYGSTNERGKEHLLHIVDHLREAAAIAAAREAALADAGGRALDQVMRQHGAPPREPRAVPVRWVPRRRNPAAASAQN